MQCRKNNSISDREKRNSGTRKRKRMKYLQNNNINEGGINPSACCTKLHKAEFAIIVADIVDGQRDFEHNFIWIH